MPRPLGPHVHGDPAHDTLRSASERLVDEVGGVIDPRALELMVDDALAPEVMVGERVDTLMLTSHVFGVDEQTLSRSPPSAGHDGLLAFTERRMIAAHCFGIVRLRRFVEAFALGDDVYHRAMSPTIEGRPLRLFELANRQGWHRIFVPGGSDVGPDVVDRWDQHIRDRLAAAIAPTWRDTTLTGWVDDDPTVPNQRLPRTGGATWWDD